jgi:hypothetical protein
MDENGPLIVDFTFEKMVKMVIFATHGMHPDKLAAGF